MILEDEPELEKLVPDHASGNRVNGPLRRTASALSIEQVDHRRLLTAAAEVDGALVLSTGGGVLDVACMIGEPSNEKLQAGGLDHLSRFSGARETAAWNASLYGGAIKVSADGPILIYVRGRLVGRLG